MPANPEDPPQGGTRHPELPPHRIRIALREVIRAYEALVDDLREGFAQSGRRP